MLLGVLWICYIYFFMHRLVDFFDFFKGQQNTKFYHTPKNQRNFVRFFAQASKKWLKQKRNALDDLN